MFRPSLKLGFVLLLASSGAYAALPTSESNDRRGKEAPAIKGTSVQGAEVALPKSGKPMVVLMFASWCPPCQNTNASLKELYQAYSEKGIQFVGLAVNEIEWEGSGKEVKPWVEEAKLPYPVLMADKEIAKAYAFKGIPTIELIGSDGKVVKTLYGRHTTEEIEAALKTLVTSAKPEK